MRIEMASYRARPVVVASLTLFLALQRAVGQGSDGQAMQFCLCPANVLDVTVVHEGTAGERVFRLAITLTAEAAVELKLATERHLGEVVEVVFDGVVLLRAPMHSTIDSGKVLSRRWTSDVAAGAVARLLRDRSLDVPCGVRSANGS